MPVLFGLSVVSCRSLVLEDRTVCPAQVILFNAPSVDVERWSYMKLSLWKDWEGMSEQMARMEDLNTGHTIEWKKGHDFEVTAITGWDGVIDGNGNYLIASGNECPEAIGGYTRSAIKEDEMYQVELPIRSLFANVFFEIEGAASGYPFKIFVNGAVDGYTLPGLRLHEGLFHCESRELNYWMRACRIPRQDEPSNEVSTKAVYAAGLKIDFYFQPQGTTEWQRFYSLPIGEIITMNGYDWSEPVLEDIHVKIHLADGAITQLVISVAEWSVVVIGDGQGSLVI